MRVIPVCASGACGGSARLEPRCRAGACARWFGTRLAPQACAALEHCPSTAGRSTHTVLKAPPSTHAVPHRVLPSNHSLTDEYCRAAARTVRSARSTAGRSTHTVLTAPPSTHTVLKAPPSTHTVLKALPTESAAKYSRVLPGVPVPRLVLRPQRHMRADSVRNPSPHPVRKSQP